MIILDTNVLSALMRQTPDRHVIEWLDRQPRTSIWTNSVTILEIRFGLQIMVTDKRRLLLTQAFETALEAMGNRIASFDAAAATAPAELMAARQKRGRPGDLRDTMIAGIVLAHRATLATRNTGHFEDLSVPVVNPWSA
jgi:predicted nucleic acid-binding protein